MKAKRDTIFFPPSKLRRVTLRDVAKRVGVSHVTISLALRNHPSIPQTRCAEVKRIADEMGYAPDPLLASLAVYRRAQRQLPIRCALAWINHWDQPEDLRQFGEFNLYWRGAEQAALRFGYHLEELRWTRELTAKRFQQILLARGVRGVLIPPHQHPPNWGGFDWSQFSVIRFGMSVRAPDTHLVTSDQMRATVMAMEHIHRRGYRKIGFILGRELDENIGGNYTGGFYASQELFGIKSADSLLLCRYNDPPARLEMAVGRWLKKVRPDAVLAGGTNIPALIRKLGYRIPQDLGMAGTSVVDIPLDAGINQNSENIGCIAVETLVAQINANERGCPSKPCRILVESSWQDGASLPARAI